MPHRRREAEYVRLCDTRRFDQEHTVYGPGEGRCPIFFSDMEAVAVDLQPRGEYHQVVLEGERGGGGREAPSSR